MTEKDLKRLGRMELLEIIAEMKRREIELTARLDEANGAIEALKHQIEDRKIRISKAGSIAEAALELNGVIESAQQAADEYLQSVYDANSDMNEKMERAEKARRELLYGAEREAAARIRAADKICAERIAAAEKEIKRMKSSVTSVTSDTRDTREPIIPIGFYDKN